MLARVHRPLEGHKVIENWVSCVPISTVLHVSLSLSERVCVCLCVSECVAVFMHFYKLCEHAESNQKRNAIKPQKRNNNALSHTRTHTTRQSTTMFKLQKSMELQVERETDSAIKQREQLTPQNAKKKTIFKQKQKTVTAIKQHAHTHVQIDIGTRTHSLATTARIHTYRHRCLVNSYG